MSCTASRATSAAASVAYHFAALTSRSLPLRWRCIQISLSIRLRTFSLATYMRASFCWISWKAAIGLPNWRRSFA